MVETELQPCASLVNTSAMCGIEKGMKGESPAVNFIAEIAAELQRERAKNAELMERISSLEAKIQQRDKESLITNEPVKCLETAELSFKRRKMEAAGRRLGDGNGIESETAFKAGSGAPKMPHMDENHEDRLINWMSTDETHFSGSDKLKDGDIAGDHEEMDDSDDEDESYEEDDSKIGYKNRESEENPRSICEEEPHTEGKGHEMRISCLQSCSSGPSELTLANTSQLTKENREKSYKLQDVQVPLTPSNLKDTQVPADVPPSGEEPCQMVSSGKTLQNKKPLKVPFCPKEIKKILESDVLLSKNAQSHTIRKIIVFASLGIRHGCEDMYELDFNHFSILRKGDPYVSPKNPGEHVLYENPGIQRKIFYQNRWNPTLCPVKILEEEKAMRPSDPSCPSCLFLCIKYGGRTRNLPQNEYVRQQMGKNKLKSFGPIMCRMAMLVHIRSGSFFFKALGITLLFMAGFPDDLVQRETKYRNLDLLQKYYRTDKDTEGEDLFLSHSDTASPSSEPLILKTSSTKPKGRRQTNSNSKSHNLPKALYQQSGPSSWRHPTQFGLMGYTSIQTHPMAAFQTTPSQAQADASTTKGLVNTISYHNQTPYHLFPPQPANSFVPPMLFWPPPNVFPSDAYPTAYGYRSFPTNANYVSIHPRPYYSHPSSSCFTPKRGIQKNVLASSERHSDSDSSSSSTEEPKDSRQCGTDA